VKSERPKETRRVPTQDRSRARVARIVDAATEVFAEVGFEAATTEAIAERAGTSIGSLYQFFPNKKALFEAIWRRYLDDVRLLFERLLLDAASRATADWRTLMDDAIDAFWEFDQNNLAFRAVMMNVQRSGAFLAEGDALNRAMAERTAPIIGVLAPKLPASRRVLVATMVVETLSGLLFLAQRRDERTARAIIDESKVMIRRYLEPYAE
jgi:AcrR family transcriptional regulator